LGSSPKGERCEGDRGLGDVKENINEELGLGEKKFSGKNFAPKPVLGNVSSNRREDKAGTPGLKKKDDKKKWLKRI
jgi:hypothetical protein